MIENKEARSTLMSLEVIQEGPEIKDPLQIAWATKWRLDDLINHLGLYAYTSVDVINHQTLKPEPNLYQINQATRAISNAAQAIRGLAVKELFDGDGEPQQIVFVYMGAMYGVTAIKESN